jgi:uncharacterized protein YbjT (DUF2867 family)
MKVVVTGGSGFVGREVVRQLRLAGHSVRVLGRNASPEPGVEWVRGSILDFPNLPTVLVGFDVVIHLVGIISEVGDQTFERVHTSGTANVVQAARTAGVRRMIHMSALGTRPNAVARYHRSKWEAEEAVRRSGLAWTIFRPSLIYGPGDGFVTFFARLARWLPALPIMGPGTHRTQPVAVEDVARCFAAAPASSTTVGQTYDLCGPEAFTFTEVMRMILAAAHRPRGLVHLPLPLARAQAAFLEVVYPTVFGSAPPLNRDQIQMLQEDNVGDPRPAAQVFGFEPRPFAEGLQRLFAGSEAPFSRTLSAQPTSKMP